MPLPEPRSLFTQSHGTDRHYGMENFTETLRFPSVGHNFNAICPVCQHADNLLTTTFFCITFFTLHNYSES